MFQTIQGKEVYVVELTEFPPPMPIHDGNVPMLEPYALALTKAIRAGIVRKPGKYAIEVDIPSQRYEIHEVQE